MPNIRPFEAPDRAIQPSEAGASALVRAGGIEMRAGAQAANSLTEEGRMIGSGISSIGQDIKQVQDKAQAHTDAMAEVDQQKSQTAALIAAQGGVSDAAATKDEDGNVIENTPGRGGPSLPSTATAPSPGQFADKTADILDQHKEVGQTILGNALASGVSQKAQDRMAAKDAAFQGQLAVHAHALAGEVAATHLIHSTEQTINMSTAHIDQDPSQATLDAELGNIHNTIGTAQGSMTGNFAKEGAKAFVPMEQKARTDAITTAASSLARKQQPDQALALLNDPKYAKDFTGVQREALQTHIKGLANQADEDSARKDAALQRKEYGQMNQQMGNAIAGYKPGTPMPDFHGDPLWMKHPEKAAQLDGVFRAHEEALLHQNQPDPNVSYQNAEKLKQDLFDPTANPDDVMDRARTAFASKGPMAKISQSDYSEIQRLYADPNAKSLGKSANDWLTKEGEGRIDPGLGSGPLAGGKSLLGQQQVRAWTDEFNRRAKADPAHAHDLLDPTKPGNMVSNEALAPYRITEALKATAAAKKDDLDAAADKARNPGGGQEQEQSSGWSVMGAIRGAERGIASVTGPVRNALFGAPGAGDASAVAKIPAGAPGSPVAPVKTEADVQKLQPNTQFIIPDGPHKGQIGTVPQKMNYAPENGGQAPAQDAITNALVHKTSLGPPDAPGSRDFGGQSGGTPIGDTHFGTDASHGNAAPMGQKASASFESVMPKIFRDEGGKTHDSGGFTNFGISARAHPGVDIANLTKARAQEIYKAKYWDPMKIDSLPDNMKHTVMDAAVNEGNQRARQMLAKSGNDPKAFNDLRREHYISLVENNPRKYAKYLTGWMNRLGRIERES